MNGPFTYPKPIDRFDQIPDAIAHFERIGCGFRTPPLQALYVGRIAYLDVSATTTSRLVKGWMAAAKLPALAIIADDPGWGIPPAGRTASRACRG